MTYNTDRRRPLTKKQRPAFLVANGSRCHYCGEPITDDAWDDDHVIPKELLPAGSDWNGLWNRRPIHRRPCHVLKTKADRRMIAKSNHVRRHHGVTEDTRKHKPVKMRSRPFPKIKRSIPSRPMGGWS